MRFNSFNLLLVCTALNLFKSIVYAAGPHDFDKQSDNISMFHSLKIWNSYIKVFPLLNPQDIKKNVQEQKITNSVIQIISDILNDNGEEQRLNVDKQVYQLLYDENPIIANIYKLYYQLPVPPIFNKSPYKEPQFFLDGKKHSLDEIYYLKSDDLQRASGFFNPVEQPVVRLHNTEEQEFISDKVIVELHCELDNEFFEVFVMEALDGKFDLIWYDTSNITANSSLSAFKYDSNSLYEIQYENGKDATFNGSKLISDAVYTEKQRKNKKGFLSNLDLLLSLEAITSHSEDTWSTLEFIEQNINEIVLKDKQQEKLKYFNLNKDLILSNKTHIESEIKELQKSGISYDDLGLFVNGIAIQQSHLSKYGLLDSIVEEIKSIEGLRRSIQKVFPQLQDISMEALKHILLEYGIMSQKLSLFSQPRKFDLLKTEKNSDCTLFVNDLEKSKQYEDINDDLMVFLQSPHEKEFPAIKENWNEIVFLLDFENEDMITDFVRAVTVTSDGFPQRIGFIPITNDLNLLNRLLQVYNNPIKLANLLKGQQSISVKEDFELEAKFLKLKVEKLLDKMNIEKREGLIVNGEIFPFRSNTWNYYISTVMNKDIQFIKSYLETILRNGDELDHSEIKLRDILHSESFPLIERDLTMTPDYFGDSMISRTNYDFILELRKLGNVFEFSKNNEYEIIHSLTLVADFSDYKEWRNVYNLLQNELYGMKIRLITLSDPENKNWLKLQDLVVSSENSLERYINKDKLKKHNNHKQTIDFSNWLLDLSAAQLASTRFAVLNGRFINLENLSDNISRQLWFNFIKFESFKTLQGIAALNIAIEFQDKQMIPMQTMEDIISYLSFYSHKDLAQGKETQKQGIHFSAETVQVRKPVNKILSYIEADKNYDLFLNSKNFQKESLNKPIDIILVVDPIEERTSKLINALKFLKPLKRVINLQILLVPTMELNVFPRQTVFTLGKELEMIDFDKGDDFEVVKVPDILALENHKSDSRVAVINGKAYVQKTAKSVRGSSRIVVETEVRDVCIRIITDDKERKEITRFSSMSTFGYSFFKVSVNETRAMKFVSCDPNYNITEFSLDINSDFSEWTNFKVADLLERSALIHIESLGTNEIIEDTDSLSVLTTVNNAHDLAKLKIIFQNTNNKYYIWNSKGSNVTKSHIENLLPDGYDCEVINVEWASWMRPTHLIKNQLNYLKYILIDSILPLSVDKVVFIDLSGDNIDNWLNVVKEGKVDTFIKSDIGNYVLGLLPYDETKDSYWKNEKYWIDFMKNHDLSTFYQTNNFVMSLKNYRLFNIGNTLRVHYQRLSTDINSLNFFDETLINNAQPEVNIVKIQFDKNFNNEHVLDEL